MRLSMWLNQLAIKNRALRAIREQQVRDQSFSETVFSVRWEKNNTPENQDGRCGSQDGSCSERKHERSLNR